MSGPVWISFYIWLIIITVGLCLTVECKTPNNLKKDKDRIIKLQTVKIRASEPELELWNQAYFLELESLTILVELKLKKIL